MMFSVRSRKTSDKQEKDPFIQDEYEKYEKKAYPYTKEGSWIDKLHDQFRLLLLTSLSFYLRIMKLGFPPYITEAELETTRQVNWYMASKFFIGKFPPLVGLVASGLTRIVGYYGTEDLLYAGQPFVEFPVIALRRMSALLGTLLIPLCYITLRNLNHSRSTATLAAALLIFENGMVTQSRYATTEIYVLFFSALATCSWTFMHKYAQESQHSLRMAYWQIMTGLAMGCALSSKWTGGLTFPVIWASIGIEAWNKMCEKQNQVKTVLRQVCTFAITVGLLPLGVYLALFHFHFSLIPKGGDHDLLLSSKLRYSLEGNAFEASQPDIVFGSQIVIKHEGTVGGYIHSHKKRFSAGSTQQEVTLYPYVDLNNIWTVHKTNELWNGTQPFELIHNKDQIRLEHFASTRKLHSHDVRPQLTNKKEHNEVTAYGDRLIQDPHDYWILHILDEEGYPSKDKNLTWKPLEQRFRLQHIRGCVLISHNVHYAPPTGENHQEVTCMISANPKLSNWIVESSFHEYLEHVTPVEFGKMTFLEKLKQVHALMLDYPNIVYDRLKSGGKSEGAIVLANYRNEAPSKWFLKRATMRLWGEMAGHAVYMVLNPIVQRIMLAMMATYVGFLSLHAFLVKRQMKLPYALSWLYASGMDVVVHDYYTKSVVFYFSGLLIQFSCLKFFPSHMVSMPDILGAVYYGLGLTSVILEACTCRLPSFWRRTCLYGLVFLSVIQFAHLSHLSYGGKPWFQNECEQADLDIDCLSFPPHPTELQELILHNGNSTTMTVYVDLVATTQAFKYNLGQEAEADKHIAILKQASFLKEAQQATGMYRFHRVVQTPVMSPEEAGKWAKDVLEGANQRQAEVALKLAEQERLKQQEKQT
ncbi:Dolichyl-phosphate-mannose-protein mannosyltransferase-domain-containing protein [Gilbertella persicaria]|uniref:Dolichyl-phosphate-mannose-protein mannosyltransferase-domain-containing protein n=1 Tax=Gilbertella persicaria TaxID=101096 RepID=UPI00221FDCCE|nr:Dolichyl-phosphate-mannose-protein mannosyltransferase-domain-containing protein [Gilbertella persicaria]KAI8066306.1 Dolichyl-phosphate-mannose-protein mannosyltransferase-domain-containing protein [Gilbertella persicaria]